MNDDPWIAWTIVTPLVGAVLAVLAGRRAPLAVAASALATVGVVAVTTWTIATGGPSHHTVGGWEAPLGIALRGDGIAALLLPTIAIVGVLVGIHATGTLRARVRSPHFLALCMFAWAALDALVLSRDVFNLYVTLELLSLATVGMIALRSARTAFVAALRYLVVALVGSLLYLLGVGLLYSMTATLDITLLHQRLAPEPLAWAAVASMTVGLSLKAGLFPLHAWLAPAYVAAPPPVSALLSGLFSKAPYIVALRLWVEVFPPIAPPGSSTYLGVLGAGAVLWSSALAVRQRKLKPMLAYSSLAHVGYLFLGIAVASPRALAGAVYVAVSHAVASAAMFTAAGTVERSVGRDDLGAMQGIARHRPATFFAFALAGASLMGLPPSGGFVAKWLLVRAALEHGAWWWAAVVLLGGLLAASYVFPMLRGAFLPLPAETRLSPVPMRTEIVPLTLAIFALALGVAPAHALALLELGGAP